MTPWFAALRWLRRWAGANRTGATQAALWLPSHVATNAPDAPTATGSQQSQTSGSSRLARRQPRRADPQAGAFALDLAPDDPLVAYCLRAPGVVEIDALSLDSPALRALQAAGMRLALPLISQGELIGVITLGPRVGGEEYATADLNVLHALAEQVAPAVRVAQLAQEQQAQARDRERLEHELSVAHLIQQTLLPKAPPELPGWRLAAYYQPARAVGGDFYDFLALPGERLGLVIGDVTDKGTPAALLMATTRSILRAAALGGAMPGAALERANDLLRHDIPPRMFVTCLYAVLEPASGRLRFANAGHSLPLLRRGGVVTPLRASGMPLGLMPGMRYEEQELLLAPDDTVLLYSDGLVEAHDPARAMFGQPRLAATLGQSHTDQSLINHVLQALRAFVGDDWEQEDDVTLVTLRRLLPTECAVDDQPPPVALPDDNHEFGSSQTDETANSIRVDNGDEGIGGRNRDTGDDGEADPGDWRRLGEWSTPSGVGKERLALAWLTPTLAPLALPTARLERLKTAVAEATMNAMEHGNSYDPMRLVYLDARANAHRVAVRISDEGAGDGFAAANQPPTTPDLAAKLAGAESPRGWGLFLIRQLVDEARIETRQGRHTLVLTMAIEAPVAQPHDQPQDTPRRQPKEQNDVQSSG